MKTALSVIGIGALALTLHAATAQAADPLRIGVATDMSGTYATLGEEVLRATRFAVEEANTAGGVAGHKVEIKTYDTEAKPDLARRQVEKLVLEGYPIVTGMIASGEGLAIAPLMERFLDIYAARNRVDAQPTHAYFLSFAFYRLAAILQGVYRRALDGNAASPHAPARGVAARFCLDQAARFAERA